MIELLIITTFFVMLAAMFSGMEVAYFSTNNSVRLELGDKRIDGIYGRAVDYFRRNPDLYVYTTWVGFVTCLVLYVLFFRRIIHHYISEGYDWLEFAITLNVIVFLAVMMPRSIVRANPNFHLKTFLVPLYFFAIFFYPVTRTMSRLAKYLIKLFKGNLRGEQGVVKFGKTNFLTLVENVSEGKSNNDNDIQILRNVLDFSSLKIRDCMSPRVDIRAIEVNSSIEKLIELVAKTNSSRIPVYDGTIDNIIGYAASRSLFEHPSDIKQIMREIIYVPESGVVQKLLEQMIKKRMSIAVVIDEFGGTAGLVTMEDILEEIFGDIEDEHDTDHLIEKKMSDDLYIFSGRHEVDYLNKEYGIGIPESDDYETLAGFILYHNENVPKVGDVIKIEGLSFKVLRASSSKISLLELKIL